jgi:superfamily I DNA/RNA helicase
MNYIGITQPTANWLLTRSGLMDSLHELLTKPESLSELKNGDLVEGSFRLSGSPDGRLLTIWNFDYSTGTGNEEWGFIKHESPLGLLDEPSISKEVFERSVRIINQRLQGLLLDSTWFHREHPNGSHTCLAGRGTVARHLSVAYVETDVTVDKGHSSRVRSIICVGPSEKFVLLTNRAVEEARNLNALVKTANELIAPNRHRPVLDMVAFPKLRKQFAGKAEAETGVEIAVTALRQIPKATDVYNTLDWSYQQWIAAESPLSTAQRRVLESDGILKHPIRIIGPAGSGKTLLMQLLAMRRLVIARGDNTESSVIYIVHNAAMAQRVRERFEILGATEFFKEGQQQLRITTLSDYGKAELQLPYTGIIDNDAHATKIYQLEEVKTALRETFAESEEIVKNSRLLSQVLDRKDLFEVFARLVTAEISTAIKGHGLVGERERYVRAERQFSRLHGLLDQNERGLVYETFQRYHQSVFEDSEVLDADDVAISLLGKMRTPIWDLKRRTIGYDYVFVDETQLFNENERRIFHLLRRGNTHYIPIVLALDEAQEIYGQTSAGFGALGIEDIANESLPSNFRSTRAIIDLAFFVIQRTIDLFGPDFPNFSLAGATVVGDDHPLAAPPCIEVCSSQGESLPQFVVRRIQEMRKTQLRQIAVVCHAETYWEPLKRELEQAGVPLQILAQRGDRLPNSPIIVLTRPAYVGGQEFDAVVAVGLEQGLVPPRVSNNDALAAALEQQTFREMYLSFTRARFQLKILIKRGGKPTRVLQAAIRADVVSREDRGRAEENP